jgi:hypothetical protein
MKTLARSSTSLTSLMSLMSLTVISLCWWAARDATAQPRAAADVAAPAPVYDPAEASPPAFDAPGQTRSCAACDQPRYLQPSSYGPQLQPPQLTPEEWAILDEGEMSSTRYAAGVVLALSPGFGIGHMA